MVKLKISAPIRNEKGVKGQTGREHKDTRKTPEWGGEKKNFNRKMNLRGREKGGPLSKNPGRKLTQMGEKKVESPGNEKKGTEESRSSKIQSGNT